MNQKEKLLEALVNNLQEADAILKDNIIEVPIKTLVKEACDFLNWKTDVDISFIDIDGNNVRLSISGQPNNITVLKDRLGVKNTNQGLESNDQVTKIKRNLINILEKNFEEFKADDLTLRSIDEDDGLVFIYFNLNLSSVPYPISLSFKLFDDGHIEIRVDCRGESNIERWSKNNYDMESFITTLNDIKSYFSNKLKGDI